MKISGNNVILTLFSKEDIIPEYISWLNDKDVVKYSRQRHIQHNYESCLNYYLNLKKNNHTLLKINIKNNKKFIGTMSYIFKSSNSVDIGILIGDKSYWGNQIGYEAWKLSINYLFSLKKIKKITAGCLVANNAMKKIMIKSNMIFSFNDKVYNKEKNIYEEFVYYEIIK